MTSLKGSGFKNLRDLLFFIIGASGLVYYLVSVQQQNGHLELGVLAFFAGVMGAPIAFNADEKKRKK